MPEPRGTALITGGSVGIGLEIAKLFAADDHPVVLVARRQDRLDAAASEIEKKFGTRPLTIALDLANAASPPQLLESVNALGIEIEFLVNNAGFGLGGQFSETSIDRELEMIQLNVASLVHLTKLFMRPMIERGHGRIMNVASTAAFQPGPLMSIYYSTKAFVLSFSQAVDEEIRNSGVTLTCLCPGPVHTEFAATAGLHESRLFTQSSVAGAGSVARYGYNAMMKGKRIAIPGPFNKLMVQVERFLPRAFITRAARKVQENR
jgi:short-subunit dehydrogenase